MGDNQGKKGWGHVKGWVYFLCWGEGVFGLICITLFHISISGQFCQLFAFFLQSVYVLHVDRMVFVLFFFQSIKFVFIQLG